MTELVTNGQAILILEDMIFDVISKTDGWQVCVVSATQGTPMYSGDTVEAGSYEDMLVIQTERIQRQLQGEVVPVAIVTMECGGEIAIGFEESALGAWGYRMAAMSAWCRYHKSQMPTDITKGPMGL